MNKINPEYQTINKVYENINQLLTDARAYAELRDPAMDNSLDESLEHRPNLRNLERKLKEVKKLSLKVDKSSCDNIKKQIKEIRNLYWGVIIKKYGPGQGSISIDLSRNPKAAKEKAKIDYNFSKDVSKRMEESDKREREAWRKLKDIIITY